MTTFVNTYSSMKKILLLLFTFSSSLLAFSQGTWTSRDTLPDSAMLQGISGFSIGNYGYAGLGEYSNAIHEFDYLWQFDASNNSWTRKANFPGSARVAPASFVIGTKAYLVTGSVKNAGACVTECWEYNSTTNIWTQKTNFPGPARTYAVGFAINGKGYVGTGAKELSDFRKDFYEYDTAGAGSWTRIADFGGIARSAASGFAVNGKGYVCFGQDSLFAGKWLNNDMWEYDPGNNTWTQKSNYPGLPIFLTSGFAICDNIYVGSGDTTRWDHEFWKYNTSTDTWTQEASVSGPTKVQGAAFAIGDTGYYGFGFDSDAIVHNIFDKFYAGDSCEITTGNKTIIEASEVSLYPNPFKDECFIKMSNSPAVNPVLSLLDVTGKEINVNITCSSPDYILKRGQLNQGVYILCIKYPERVYYKKLVITN